MKAELIERRTKVIFSSKHVHVCCETKTVWHSQLSGHPVPIQAPVQVAFQYIPCSATALVWLISCSLEQMSGLTSPLPSWHTILIWRNPEWQFRETLTILLCGCAPSAKDEMSDKLEAVSHFSKWCTLQVVANSLQVVPLHLAGRFLEATTFFSLLYYGWMRILTWVLKH